MNYLASNKATNFKAPGIVGKLIYLLTYPFQTNPGYESNLHLVRKWLIEFTNEGMPDREIGLDTAGNPILAGPDKRNYGYWLDTSLTINDFEQNYIDKKQFEDKWNEYWSHKKYSPPT